MTYDPNESRDNHGRWSAGSASAEESQAQAAKIAGSYPTLPGLPNKPIKLGNEYYTPGPNAKIQDAAKAYMESAGIPYDPPKQYVKVDPANGEKIAKAFEDMKHDPDDPKVKASYEAMAKELDGQWQAIKATGLKVDWIGPDKDGNFKDPYADSPRRAAMDVSENNHLYVFPTDLGFGSGDEASKQAMKNNPLLKETGETISGRKVVVNDVLRIVHDVFGHFKEGNGFRADGEDNAWRSHVAMFSDAAKPAMTSETRGQNNWVNFGPHAAANKHASAADTVYAPQKIGIMPDWTWKNR